MSNLEGEALVIIQLKAHLFVKRWPLKIRNAQQSGKLAQQSVQLNPADEKHLYDQVATDFFIWVPLY